MGGIPSLMVLKNALEQVQKDAPTVIPQKIAAMAAPIIYQDVKNIFDQCVDNFYAAYSPIYYRRTNSLKKAYNITLSGTYIGWKVSADLMPNTHRVDSEYIFQYVFEEGWHGGAISGKNHPSPGTPWWRTPHPSQTTGIPWRSWGSAAFSSMSASNMIESEINSYQNSDRIKIILDMCTDKVLSTYLLFRMFN